MSNEHEQHVKDWYAKLCAEMRQAELKSPDTPCEHCGRARKDHHYKELTCDLYVTSLKFRAVNQDEINRMAHVLNALDSLADACGWRLA